MKSALPYFHNYAIEKPLPIDLSLSENPIGPSPQAMKAVAETRKRIHIYPHEEKYLISLIAKHHNISEEMIFIGAGANQLLEDFLKVFALGKKIVVPSITFPESIACMKTIQGSTQQVPLTDDFRIDTMSLLNACTKDTALIHLCNPNNPTGAWTKLEHLLQLAADVTIPVLISEAGADFIGQTIITPTLAENLIVIRSFSKIYGLAGLRIGYSVASPKITALMKGHTRPYRVSTPAVAAACAAIQDQNHLRNSVAYISQEKKWLIMQMEKIGFSVIPSEGHNFLAHIPQQFTGATQFCNFVKDYGLAVVDCSIYPGLERYIRVSPRKRKINIQFIKTLKRILSSFCS